MQSSTQLQFIEKKSITDEILDLIIENAVQYIHTNHSLQLIKRKFLKITDEKNISNEPYKFRMMSYNIMAESLKSVTSIHLPFETKFSDWNYRSHLIIQEIKAYNPDILCLQELDHDDTIIRNALKDYDWYYKKRLDHKKDGCAIFFKHEKYNLLLKKEIEFKIDPTHRLLCKENIAQIIVLQPKVGPSDCLLVIANTHILFSDRRGEIKTTQIHLTIKAIKKICNLFPQYDKLVCYGGDFNLTPKSGLYEFIRQGIFDFSEVTRQHLSGQKHAFQKNYDNFSSLHEHLIANSNHYKYNPKLQVNDLDEITNWVTICKSLIIDDKDLHENSIETIKIVEYPINPNSYKNDNYFFSIKNDLYFKSAYSSFLKAYYQSKDKKHSLEFERKWYSTYESLVSCCCLDQMLNVDYIWYCIQRKNQYQHNFPSFYVASVFELPRLKDILTYKVYPNKNYPSDHFSLVVDFIYG